MKLDIVIVTYNSEKWIKNCISSIENQKKINLNDINIYFVDNASSDNTVLELERFSNNTKLGSFNIIKSDKNLGFGRGNNLGFTKGNSEYVLFLNIDIKMEEDTIYELLEGIKKSDKNYTMWEMRQKPYEHPKLYDILTNETSWASGACVTFKRDVFKEIGMFDSKIFMYAEDVDISWRNRAKGYKIKYLPKSTIYHYCYKEAGEIKPTQYYYSIINNFNLRLRFGNIYHILKWYVKFLKILLRKDVFKNSRINLIKKYIQNMLTELHFFFWRLVNLNKSKDFKPKFIGFDYEKTREGSFIEINEIANPPLVSVLVRTCARPNILRECLISLRNQTYKNIEIIVSEDGKNVSEKMIKEEFSDLNIVYKCSNKKIGRCKNGNVTLENAKGKYLNFLDDDDLFYADHIETLVYALESNKQYEIAYSLSYESRIQVISKEPEYVYKEISKKLVHNKKFSRITLLTRNAFPIQTVMFKKDIYLKYGGFDLELDNLEDWELWARYAMNNKFLFVPKITSIFRVPAKQKNFKKRQSEIDTYYNTAREKILKNNIYISAKDLLEESENI